MGVLNFFSRSWGGGLKGQRRVGGVLRNAHLPYFGNMFEGGS